MVLPVELRVLLPTALVIFAWLNIDTTPPAAAAAPAPATTTTTTNEGIESVLKSNTFWDRHLFSQAESLRRQAAPDYLQSNSIGGAGRRDDTADGDGGEIFTNNYLGADSEDELSLLLFATEDQNDLDQDDDLDLDLDQDQGDDDLDLEQQQQQHLTPSNTKPQSISSQQAHPLAAHSNSLANHNYNRRPPTHTTSQQFGRNPTLDQHPTNKHLRRRRRRRRRRHRERHNNNNNIRSQAENENTNNDILQHAAQQNHQHRHHHHYTTTTDHSTTDLVGGFELADSSEINHDERSQQVPEQQSPIVVSSSDNSYVSASPIVNPNYETMMISTTATTTTSSGSGATAEADSEISEASDQFREEEEEEVKSGSSSNTHFNAHHRAAAPPPPPLIRNGQLNREKFNNLIGSNQRRRLEQSQTNGQQADKDFINQHIYNTLDREELKYYHPPYDQVVDNNNNPMTMIRGEMWHHVSEKTGSFGQNSNENENLIISPDEMSPSYVLPISNSDSEVVLVDDQTEQSSIESSTSTNGLHYFNIVRGPQNVVQFGSNNHNNNNKRRFWQDSHLASIKIEQQETYGLERGGWVSSAIAIMVGISATGMLVLVIGHKMRSIKMKGRRRSLVPDTDFLINTIPI